MWEWLRYGHGQPYISQTNSSILALSIHTPLTFTQAFPKGIQQLSCDYIYIWVSEKQKVKTFITTAFEAFRWLIYDQHRHTKRKRRVSESWLKPLVLWTLKWTWPWCGLIWVRVHYYLSKESRIWESLRNWFIKFKWRDRRVYVSTNRPCSFNIKRYYFAAHSEM